LPYVVIIVVPSNFPRIHSATFIEERAMSKPIPEQWSTAQKAGLDAFRDLASKAFGSMRELTELNLQTVNSALTENQELLAKAISSKNPQELFALPAALVRPTLDRAVAYGREVSVIVSRVHAECSTTTAALAQQYQRNVQAVLESVAASAPDVERQS
jgi:phasin family protein